MNRYDVDVKGSEQLPEHDGRVQRVIDVGLYDVLVDTYFSEGRREVPMKAMHLPNTDGTQDQLDFVKSWFTKANSIDEDYTVELTPKKVSVDTPHGDNYMYYSEFRRKIDDSVLHEDFEDEF